MTAEEKARDIVTKFELEIRMFMPLGMAHLKAKNLAKMAVEEIVSHCEELSIGDSGQIFRDFGHIYWRKVLNEIQKL